MAAENRTAPAAPARSAPCFNEAAAHGRGKRGVDVRNGRSSKRLQ